ncbi:hypothetical protein F4780DRAFT_373138 [Xylariomycetidae sp. FL0641]|nr:hypothetical protein F4780DRAFT_373138 [Xylariomycetidae sp. FL0641]
MRRSGRLITPPLPSEAAWTTPPRLETPRNDAIRLVNSPDWCYNNRPATAHTCRPRRSQARTGITCPKGCLRSLNELPSLAIRDEARVPWCPSPSSCIRHHLLYFPRFFFFFFSLQRTGYIHLCHTLSGTVPLQLEADRPSPLTEATRIGGRKSLHYMDTNRHRVNDVVVISTAVLQCDGRANLPTQLVIRENTYSYGTPLSL